MKKAGKQQPAFVNIETATNGRVPLLKATHRQSGVAVDINFTGHTSIFNNYLIKFLIQLDSRIKPMIVIIKSIFKLNNYFGPSLTNFNLYCLIIFFLQAGVSPPLLVPVKFLLNTDKPLYVEERWNINFKATKLPVSNKNKSTLLQLLSSFFLYYANFDFETIISPYMGVEIKRDEFKSIKDFQCPESQFQFNLDNKALLQDFFMLNVSLSARFSVSDFQAICLIQHETIEKSKTLGCDVLQSILFNPDLRKFKKK